MQSATIKELMALDCCNNPTEIQQLQLSQKNLVHKGVDFYVQNAVNLRMSIFIFQKKISDVKGERKGCVMAVGGNGCPFVN